MDTEGNQFISWDELKSDDIVIIPAFGTTVEIQKILEEKGIETASYNTTCPFVEKVWKRSAKLGADSFTVIIHGKARHEETRATFSHSYQGAPSLIIKNMEEAIFLADVILGTKSSEDFYAFFEGKYSQGFDAAKDLEKLGVVNQTTMLASDTQDIANFLKEVMTEKYGESSYKSHFADTRDTLCYATNDNQQATYGVLEKEADLALVVGGYNSSNTSHIAELCERKLPTYFIKSETEILSFDQIRHFNYPQKKLEETTGWMPKGDKVRIILTSGASCPDAVVDRVMQSILSLFGNEVAEVDATIKDALAKLPE
jgi:4-hydroxy-3-methylbut-2-enyl diphosphate reductase